VLVATSRGEPSKSHDADGWGGSMEALGLEVEHE
jgi:hypothetical protein